MTMDAEISEETWVVSASRKDKLEVGEFCPWRPYLEVLVPNCASSVQSITITTVSHDQGKSSALPQ